MSSATAVTNGSTNYPKWGLSWTYDRYANRSAQTVTYGSPPSNAVTPSPTTNRFTDTGYAYDANGNMTDDGPNNTITYDAENRMVSLSPFSGGTASYSYDGNNLRVKKVFGSTTTVYIFSGSKVIAEYTNGSLAREYIYSGGNLLATVEGATTKYYHADHLSERLTTDPSGTKMGEQGHYPFGESWYATGTTTQWQFTSYERDTESSNDYAMFRSHINRFGRFSSPDPLGGDVTDPQSLNRYAYVLNDPTNFSDPLGLVNIPPWEGGGGGGGCIQWEWVNDEPAGGHYKCVAYGDPDRPDGPVVPPDHGGGGGGGGHGKKGGAGCGHSPTYNKEKCEEALKTAGQTMAAVQNALNNWSMIEQAAVNNGVDPTILAAIGIRESGFQNIPQNNGGPGMGIFQIESTSFPNAVSFAYDPSQAANFTAAQLGGYYRTNVFKGMNPVMAAGAAIRSWNRGPYGATPALAATGWPGYLDVGTAKGNYVSNVAAIALYCF